MSLQLLYFTLCDNTLLQNERKKLQNTPVKIQEEFCFCRNDFIKITR